MNEIMSALVLGIIIGATPGPGLMAIFTEILQSNYKRSLKILFWIMSAISIIAIISLIIFSVIRPPEIVFNVISVIGSAVLLLIAFSAWKIKELDQGLKINFTPVKIFGMTLGNGILWTFWITVCVPQAFIMADKMKFGAYIFSISAIMGMLFSLALLGYIFSRFRTIFIGTKKTEIVYKIIAIIFMYFSIDMLYKSFDFFK